MTHAFMGLTVKGVTQMSNQAMSNESKSLQQRSRGLPEHIGEGKETGGTNRQYGRRRDGK